MQKFIVENLVPLDLELEKKLRKIIKEKKEAIEFEGNSMENLEGFRKVVVSKSGESVPPHDPPMEYFERALRDYALPHLGIPPMIKQPVISANNFEIKPITLGFYYQVTHLMIMSRINYSWNELSNYKHKIIMKFPLY